MELIEIDGNLLEGGGQILRSALAFSVITGKPFHIFDIRKGREDPGLKAQHLQCIRLLKELSDLKVEGDEIRSNELYFYPGKIETKNIVADIGTAGSITLVLQSLLPAIIASGKRVRLKIRGGTDVSWSPSFDYFESNLLPLLNQFSSIKTEVISRGFYPKGGGLVDVQVKERAEESKFLSFNLQERGRLLRIHGRSVSSSQLRESEVSERQAKGAKRDLSEMEVKVSIDTCYVQTESIGTCITLWGEFENCSGFISSCSLGQIRKRAEAVGREAAQKFMEEHSLGAVVDSNLADQLVPYMALFPGSSIKTSWITDHTLANIYVIKKFMQIDFDVDKDKKIISSRKIRAS